MYFPVRCFSCGAPIAQLWEEYQNRLNKGEKPADILNDLKVRRICCRRMFLSHVEVSEELIKYDKF
ncbi:MAG: DNA-directed RNA polymerase subunit N [Candidatus Anstonellaceae archaeon]